MLRASAKRVELTLPETCPKCGGEMQVSRRSPHPVIVNGEKQILTCQDCGAKTSRSVTQDGAVIV